jgi:hypothetical protein
MKVEKISRVVYSLLHVLQTSSDDSECLLKVFTAIILAQSFTVIRRWNPIERVLEARLYRRRPLCAEAIKQRVDSLMNDVSSDRTAASQPTANLSAEIDTARPSADAMNAERCIRCHRLLLPHHALNDCSCIQLSSLLFAWSMSVVF